MTPKNKNICIITSSLGHGGAEKVAALQSQMLHNLGCHVFVVSIMNPIEYKYAGKLLNLGALKDEKDGFFHRMNRFIVFKKFLQKNHIDLIIDHRSRNSLARELLLKHLVYQNIKTVFMVHSHNLLKSFPKNKIIANYLYPKNTAFVSVSKGIKEKIKSNYQLDNVNTIYNSFQLSSDNKVVVKTHKNYILFFGRLDEEAKDLTFLIKAYHKSILPAQNIQLYILGDGPDLHKLIALVTTLELTQHVVFKSATTNPFPIVKSAKLTVLTSNFEGFPMSLVESLACETPVISVDCESGPSEIIINKHNGLLVKKDLDTFTNALNLMISDNELLAFCKSNSLQSIEHLSFDNIQQEWAKFLESIL